MGLALRNKLIVAAVILLLYTTFVVFVSRSLIPEPVPDNTEIEQAEKKIKELQDSLEINQYLRQQLQARESELAAKDGVLTKQLNQSRLKHETRIKSIPVLPDDTLIGLLRDRYNLN